MFMESIDTMCDLGCGKEGLDLEWWATREVDTDDAQIPLDIKCTGIDIYDNIVLEHKNVTYLKHDLEEPLDQEFDVLWCHNTFQYMLNPLQTLKQWNSMLTEGGMLTIILPQTTNIQYNKQNFSVPNCHYFNYTISNLIYMLSVNGFDCASGFFQQDINNPWIKIVAYKSDVKPMNPRETTWVDLIETELLPVSAVNTINRHGYVEQQELTLTWLDKTNQWFGQ
jgi:SAM-dependent methyltransferase